MSDTPSSTTPRMGDTSSSGSPRAFLEQTPNAGSNHQPPNGVPKVSFNTLPQSGGGLVFDDAPFRPKSPESDVVTSSDDEEQKSLNFFSKGAVSQLSSRRPSYAAEFHTRQRPYSITSGGPLSPTASHPTTPQGDTATWAASVSAGSNVSTGAGPPLVGPFWGGSIWNLDPSRKSPPKGLNMASQSANGAPNPNPLFAGSEALPSPTSLSANSNAEFSIPIPLQPQYRNYRSMSFSVGQDDQTRQRLSPPAMLSGARHPQPGLQHRPSRPSLLSGEQFADSSTPLRSVFETDDEENGRFGEGSQPPVNYFQNHPAGYSRTKYDPASFRGRSASAATIPTMHHGVSGLALVGKENDRIDESALAEEDDMDFTHYQEHRRFSEAPPRAMSLMYQGAENQRLENLRQTWQSGGMFGLGESGAQSRRHSFAGLGADFAGSDPSGKRNPGSGESENGLGSRGNNYLSLTDVSHFDNSRKESLYVNENSRIQPRQSFPSSKTTAMGSISATAATQHHVPQLQAYSSNTQTSPPPAHRPLMGISMHSQPRSQQLLYFVTFKACRGDVFYVQEGTGLRVCVGDLVIVEADRGTDLGTVIAENISWQRAKELKEHYAKEQYNVLMMYASRRATAPGAPPATGTGSLNGVNSATFTNGNSATAMTNHGQAQSQDGQTADLKPKMIKRLAQPHEIQTLRDKEANEAKAKRVCQQKVLEHRLPMEILDAEFQMDWKKLTFYYFADSYINFNSLVTDLFKVYKTRIWMSAMNPASFAHPAAPGISSPGPLGPIGEASSDALHSQYGGQGQTYSAYASGGATSGILGVQRAPTQQNALSQQAPMTGFPPRHSPTATDFIPHNGYSPAYLDGNQQHLFTLGEGHGPTGSPDWMGLQGLSLNSH